MLATLAVVTLLAWLRSLFSRDGARTGAGVSPSAPGSGPARLLIMRHAEKPQDKGNMHLSPAGEVRAARLARYVPDTFGRPDFLIAAMRSKHSDRSYETLVPLSQALGLTIDTRFKDDDPDAVIEALARETVFAGKFGVICWHHSALPALIGGLGAPAGTFPPAWNGDVFNLVVEMRYDAVAAPAVRLVTEPF